MLGAGAGRTLRCTSWPHEGKTALGIAEAEGKAEVAALLREAQPAVRPPPTSLPHPHRPHPPTPSNSTRPLPVVAAALLLL